MNVISFPLSSLIENWMSLCFGGEEYNQVIEDVPVLS